MDTDAAPGGPLRTVALWRPVTLEADRAALTTALLRLILGYRS